MVDCSLLTYKSSVFILPTLAIAEAIILPVDFTFNADSMVVGHYEWHQESCPILTMDLVPIGDGKIKNPKIALLHSVQAQSTQPFFAVLFEGQTRRLKTSPENIVWADQTKNKAMLTEKKVQTEVILIDLARLSKEAELTSTDTQIAK